MSAEPVPAPLTPAELGAAKCDAEPLITPVMAKDAARALAADLSKQEPAKPDAA